MKRLARIAALASLLLAGPAHAQPPDAATRQRASEHFDRGIVFFNEGRFDAALAELGRAYELAPAHQTLYNLARVHAALGHAVEATAAYARYLEEAGDALGARRRREAEQALEEQRARIGQLLVVTDVPHATIALDGVDVATTPLPAPLDVSAGAHAVEIYAPGHERARRAVAIAGRALTRIEVELREEAVPRGALRVTSSVPETSILVDATDVGLTPLSSTLPLRAGLHTVTARRLGYREETQRVEIEEGAEVELHFDMRREPAAPPEHIGRLRLVLPDAPFLVRVDGEAMLGVDLELPVGAHVVSIEVTDRRPYEGTVRIQASSGVDVQPPLTWTLDARTARLASAEERRVLGVGLTVSGGVLAAGMLALVIWNETEIARSDDRLLFINEQLSGPCELDFDRECDELLMEGETLMGQQETQNVLRGVGIAGALLGAVVGGLGVALWTTAPSEDVIDAGARARLRIAPGGLSLDGAF